MLPGKKVRENPLLDIGGGGDAAGAFGSSNKFQLDKNIKNEEDDEDDFNPNESPKK